MPHDPRTDPQPGDVIHKGTASRVIERRVTRRDGNNIFYKTHEAGSEKCAWITTWRGWARDAQLGAIRR